MRYPSRAAVATVARTPDAPANLDL
jgi:hypothetical protein